MRFAEAENLARSVHNDRPGKGLELPKGTSQCPMKSYRTRGVSPRGAGTGQFGRCTAEAKLRREPDCDKQSPEGAARRCTYANRV